MPSRPESAYLGEFEQVVLLAVARLDREAYGMAIRRTIEEQSGRRVSIGAVYVTIQRLLDKWLLTAQAAERNLVPDPRARRFYTLTSEGVRALEASRELQARMWAGIRLKKAGRRT